MSQTPFSLNQNTEICIQLILSQYERTPLLAFEHREEINETGGACRGKTSTSLAKVLISLKQYQ